MVKVGDTLPDVVLYEDTPANKVNLRDVFRGKKGVLFAVPGAFTPGCSKTHLPSYINEYQSLKAKGAEVLVCVAVNDPFVMAAWGESQGARGKVRMLADTHRDLTRAFRLELDATAALGGPRSQRYSMVIDDNVIKTVNVEEPKGMACSLANVAHSQLSKL